MYGSIQTDDGTPPSEPGRPPNRRSGAKNAEPGIPGLGKFTDQGLAAHRRELTLVNAGEGSEEAATSQVRRNETFRRQPWVWQVAGKLFYVSLRALTAFSRERSATGSNLRFRNIDKLGIASSPTAPRYDSLLDFFSNLLGKHISSMGGGH